MGGSQTKEPPASPPGPTREEKLKKLETKGSVIKFGIQCKRKRNWC